MTAIDNVETRFNKAAALETADRRNKLIPPLIAKKRVYRPIDPVSAALGKAVTIWHILGYDVIGKENLASTRELIREGAVVIGASHHDSDGNSLEIKESIADAGFPDLANQAIFPAGLKMIERGYIRPFVGAVRTVLVAPPNYTDGAKKILAQSDQYEVTLHEEQTFRAYIKNCQILNIHSMRRTIELTRRGGMVLLYPTTTRSRDGYLLNAADEAEIYFRMKNAWVLPISVTGTSAIVPPEGAYQPFKKVVTRMVVGKPYPASGIFTPELPPTIGDRVPRRVDVPMMSIASLNTEIVHSGDLEFYRELSGYFPAIPGFQLDKV